MPKLPYPPSRPLSVGETLDLAFRIYRESVIKCLPLAAIAMLASQLPALYLLLAGRGLKVPYKQLLHDSKYWEIYLLTVFLTLVLNAAIVLRQYRTVRGVPPGGELATAVRRIPALLLMTVLFWLAILVCMTPIAAGVMLPGVLAIGAYLVAAALACYVLVSLSAAFAVLLIDPATPVASFARSWRLTRGSFWRLTAIYTVAVAVLVVAYLLIGIAGGFVSALMSRGDLAVVTAAYAVVMVALGAFAIPFYTAVQLAVLGDLAARREGTDLAQRIAATA